MSEGTYYTDLEPDVIHRSPSHSGWEYGDVVTVTSRPRATYKFLEHVVNETRDDEYVRLLGVTPRGIFGKTYTVRPDELESG